MNEAIHTNSEQDLAALRQLRRIASRPLDPGLDLWMAILQANGFRAARAYLRNRNKETLAQVTYGPFTSVVLRSRMRVIVTGRVTRPYMLLVHEDDQSHPVPTGFWMDFWDPDTKRFSGLTRAAYARLPVEQRAEAEARTQVMRYAASQYWWRFGSFWHPADGKTGEPASGAGAARWSRDLDAIPGLNEYWRRRLAKIVRRQAQS